MWECAHVPEHPTVARSRCFGVTWLEQGEINPFVTHFYTNPTGLFDFRRQRTFKDWVCCSHSPVFPPLPQFTWVSYAVVSFEDLVWVAMRSKWDHTWKVLSMAAGIVQELSKWRSLSWFSLSPGSLWPQEKLSLRLVPQLDTGQVTFYLAREGFLGRSMMCGNMSCPRGCHGHGGILYASVKEIIAHESNWPLTGHNGINVPSWWGITPHIQMEANA